MVAIATAQRQEICSALVVALDLSFVMLSVTTAPVQLKSTAKRFVTLV